MSLQSQEIKDLVSALCKVQSEMKGAVKDSSNPFFKSKYADLESCWEAARLPLTKNGLSIVQTLDYENGVDLLVTTLAHSSGQWIKGRLRIVPTKADPQAVGSAITYARRYAFAAIVGLIQTDDDGEAAMGRVNKPNVPGNSVMPTEQDGNTAQLHYKIPFGKFAQRSLEEVGADKLRDYVNYLENKAKKDGKTITGQVADFISRAAEFIGAFENSDIPF